VPCLDQTHAPDWNIVGRIDKHHLRALALEQHLIAILLKRVADEQPMLAEPPQITRAGCRLDRG